MSKTNWTDEQLAAITTRRCNLLVAAAAGSGKTAVLVERIIRIITDEENEVDIDKLLVVTFTNAAAAEMRERIADAISKEIEKGANSTKLLKQLTLLSRSYITTMHSFCLDVIKNNYHTIDLDPAFRIGDDTEGTLLKLEVIEELFEEEYEKGEKEFLNLVEAYCSSKNDQELKDIILDLYKFCMSGPWPEIWLKDKAEEFNINSIEELNKTSWVKVLEENTKVDIDSCIVLMEKAIDTINETEGLEPYLPTFNEDLNSLNIIFDALGEGLDKSCDAISKISFSRLKSIRKTAVSDENLLESVKNIRNDVKKKISEIQKEVFSMSPQEFVDSTKGAYPYMKKLSELVLEFKYRFSKKKKEISMLDFNDLEHLCLKILINEEGGKIKPSNVALNFKEHFDEVLVDEYQDSNNVQETIIDLVSRKYSENPNVFMVGDVKQSIYRFRQAKPELFLDKYRKYSLKEGKNRKIQLYKNFRSRFEVITGVNFIFKQVMSRQLGELEYTDEEALNLGANYKLCTEENSEVGGPIEIHIVDKKEEQQSTTDEKSQEADDEDLGNINIEAKIVAKRIKQLMSNENGKAFKVLDKNTNEYRHLKYKDIVILLRATKNWSEIFLDELGKEGIPIYADTGSGYFEAIEIRTVMSLLKVIDNPMQDVPLIALLRSPIVGFSAEELADLRLINKENYFYENLKILASDEYEAKEEIKIKAKNIIANINKWRDEALYTAIDELIWKLYKDTAYYGYVGAMPNGVLRQANLRILFQRAKQFEKTSFKGLFNFINFINKLRNSAGDMGSAKILGENEDVVRIMSIHKSKGLEFPVTFLSGAGKNFNLRDLNNEIIYHHELGLGPNFVDLDKRVKYSTLAREAINKKIKVETLSEEMRILYVAFTRAKEKLIVTGSVRDIVKTINKWISGASLDENRITSAQALKGRSYLDWIGYALCNHEDGNKLREYVDAQIFKGKNDLSTWDINIWSKNEIIVDDKKLLGDKNQENDLFINTKVEFVDKEIEKRLGYKYKFIEATSLNSNFSVSDVKKKNQEEDELNTGETLYKEPIILKPKFMQEEKGLSSAEKGTAIHFVMQAIDLRKVSTLKDIMQQLNEMVQLELLSEEEFKIVRGTKILKFFQSQLGQRMIMAFNKGYKVYRELPFYTEINAKEIVQELSEDFIEEKIRLQGIIDCFFEEEDGIVLLDYKTDYVEDANEEELINKYKIQVKYYEDAIYKITGKLPKDNYLYSFYLDKEIKL